jgi:hypothetical protein
LGRWDRRGRYQHPAVVVGYPRDPRCIMVQLAGNKTPSSYHCSFWEPVPEDP